MKFNKWTVALAAAGLVSLTYATQAEEAKNQVLTALSSTTLSGYVDTSAIWEIGTGGSRGYNLRAYDGVDKKDGFNLNVVKLSLEKPLDEGQWAAGYKVDMLFGPDAKRFEELNNDLASNDFAIQQAYVNLRVPVQNGIDFKMGVFDSILGAEKFDSYANPNYSRSFGYLIEPFQHTGLLASYQCAEWLSLNAGVANTYNSPINGRGQQFGNNVAESVKTYMGSVTFIAPESMGFLKGSTLTAGAINGFEGNSTEGKYTGVYVGGSMNTPVEGLSIGGSWDYRRIDNQGINQGLDIAYAVAGYAKYQATEKLSFANRFEYANGAPGTWVGYATREKLLADTFTVDYSLWANVVTRAEFRWDHYAGGAQNWYPFSVDPNPTDTGDKNAYSLALNVIYKF
jgi:hypothetical protein